LFISVVIPVYNEEGNLKDLFNRTVESLSKIGSDFEIIFVNDGSSDQSLSILESFYEQLKNQVVVIDFQRNFGQHMAIMAGFEKAKGDVIVTLDADLQNPPEEIANLLEQIKQGHDYVGSFREARKDSWFRTYVSKLVNIFREKVTNIRMNDQGCMLRAYSRKIIEQIIDTNESSTFIPALAYSFANNPTEIPVKHNVRVAGVSKYNLYKLIRLNFDLITGFSLVPLQFFTIFGMFISMVSGFLVAYMLLRRLIIGPEAEGLFTLFAILFFLLSVVITGVGLVGEYIGRIFQNTNQRPRYVVKKILERKR
jgi:undecaprenyl-phosphate 4-deoxy-4-formamido-L-arabinose transferase